MKLLSTLLLVVSIVHVYAARIPSKNAGEKLIVRGKQRRWMADDLKAYHQAMRKTHKNYIPGYPDAPILVPVTIGTPEKEFSLSFETGSEAFFVLAPDYPALNATEHLPYDPTKSKTSEYAGEYEEYSGDITVFGSAYVDLVGLFGFEQFYVGKQRIGVVNAAYDDYSANPALPDGVGSGRCGEPKRELLDEGRVYSVLTHFGGCLDEICEQPTPANTYPLVWIEESRSLAFQLDAFLYNGDTYAGGYAKVDTGVPHVLFPWESLFGIYNDVQPNFDFEHNIYTVDCKKAGSLPDWSFVIGGNNYPVPSSTYVVDLLLPDGQCALSAFFSDWETTDYVLGYVFHDLWCVKMDIDNQSISLLTVLPNIDGQTTPAATD